jgi:hypothetical protein
MIDVCMLCGCKKDDHKTMHHLFVDENQDPSLSLNKSRGDSSNHDHPGSQGLNGSALRGDPVMRLLLIRKGVITPEELSAIEDELKISGIAQAVAQSRSS